MKTIARVLPLLAALPRLPRLPRLLPLLACLAAFAVVALAFAVAGCSIVPGARPDPTRYYVLAVPGQFPASASLAGKSDALAVGLRHVQIAPYLDHREIVLRVGPNETVYQPYARWAEPLGAAIQQQIALRFLRSGKISRLLPEPFPFDTRRAVDVSIRVTRCEGLRKPDGRMVASFAAVIETSDPASGTILSRQGFSAPEIPWDGRDFAALAGALSESVARVSDALLATLTLPGKP
ncbi:MAG: PqiC family protein [Opitutaceae bacterium]|nr:PqiC family protein [Opitutaceae bacterium]